MGAIFGQLNHVFAFWPGLHLTVATLEPMIRIGKLKSDLDLIIGVPTVKRSDNEGEVSYFMKMLSSIVIGAGHRNGLKNFSVLIKLTVVLIFTSNNCMEFSLF